MVTERMLASGAEEPDDHPGSNGTPMWYRKAMEQPGESHFLNVDGAAIHSLHWGHRSGEKPLLLLLHGLRAHARWWDFLAPMFASSYHVVAMDFSGMGDSARRESYDVSQFAREIIAVAQTYGAGAPVNAVGHSYGGGRLLRACYEQPSLFERAIAVDAHVYFRDDNLRMPPQPLGTKIYASADAAIARFRLTPEQPDTPNFLLTHVARHGLKHTDDGWRWKLDPAVTADGHTEIDGETLLSGISVPVDVVVGEQSKVVSQALAQRIATHLVNARGPITIPSGHHHLMLDQPIALVATINALLANQTHGAPHAR
ncbi:MULTISPECIES: alpha/beta fold hydrolase [Pandoraea]|uniref:Alpha/beta hydrolase n=1 Tax=Pandoraea cepalis TaxID=2508294 RepID=A0AAW7MH98_9BURK|nr:MULTISPECIES: alpha/beta hydrolase [Pandoraea]MDN4572089.1 alpha/beta hydrolase [Pandoraea cepalis]MDN4576745.1 alpha/beta hydrolase [Pandoraea cepalis]RRW92394.1 alpha/beta hydrolase [Pandoraea apista]RRX01860.1 alpha/beta hydrolase [Pandoraea apista]CFB65556.1 Putative aminoacrylate hydrolase RutD [Pandoraea apista]